MTELVYADAEAQRLCREKWPACKIEDASDDIHPERFEIEVDCPQAEFYQFACENGFVMECLTLQLHLHTPRAERRPETNALIDGLIAIVSAAKAKRTAA
jgi:hypothetical protein